VTKKITIYLHKTELVYIGRRKTTPFNGNDTIWSKQKSQI